MQIHELTKQQKQVDEGLLDTIKASINAATTGYKTGTAATGGSKVGGAAGALGAATSPGATAIARNQVNINKANKDIEAMNKKYGWDISPAKRGAGETFAGQQQQAPSVATPRQNNSAASQVPAKPRTTYNPRQGTIVVTTSPAGMEYFKTSNGAWFEKPDSRPDIFVATGAMQIKDPVKTATLEKFANKQSHVIYVKPATSKDGSLLPGNLVPDPVAQRKANKQAYQPDEPVNENHNVLAARVFPPLAKKYLDSSLFRDSEHQYLDTWEFLDFDTRHKINDIRDPAGDPWETGGLQLDAIKDQHDSNLNIQRLVAQRYSHRLNADNDTDGSNDDLPITAQQTSRPSKRNLKVDKMLSNINLDLNESLLEFLQQDLQSFKSKK